MPREGSVVVMTCWVNRHPAGDQMLVGSIMMDYAGAHRARTF